MNNVILKRGKELVKTVLVTVSLGKSSSKIVIKSTARSITKLLTIMFRSIMFVNLL